MPPRLPPPRLLRLWRGLIWFSPERQQQQKGKTLGSHARCCCNDRECEGVGSISHCAYIQPYCNRGTIWGRVPNPLGVSLY